MCPSWSVHDGYKATLHSCSPTYSWLQYELLCLLFLAAQNKNVKEETAQKLLNHQRWGIRAGADDKMYYFHSQVDVFVSIGCREDTLTMIMCNHFPELSLPGSSFSCSVLPQKPNNQMCFYRSSSELWLGLQSAHPIKRPKPNLREIFTWVADVNSGFCGERYSKGLEQHTLLPLIGQASVLEAV